MRILTFADMGVGNLVWYLPTLRALSVHDLTVVCHNPELKQLIDYNVPCSFKMEGSMMYQLITFYASVKKILRVCGG